jgi:hypothetical protein
MCKPAPLKVVTLALVALCAAPTTTTLTAQTTAEVDRQIGQLRDSLKANTEQLARLRDGRVTVPDDSIIESGVTVHFPSERLSDRDRAVVREGIGAARARLDTQFGAGASKLVDGTIWRIDYEKAGAVRRPRALLVEGRNLGDLRTWSAPLPLGATSVSDFVYELAERQMVRRAPAVGAFAGGAFPLSLPPEAYYVAMKQLTISKSSVARRCAAGVVVACRTILDDNAKDQWYAPSDSGPRGRAPIPRGVHGSLVVTALELGGTRAIDAFGSPSQTGDVVAMLSDAAGIPPDSLIRTWNGRMQLAAKRSAHTSVPFAATAIFWSGLFLFAATRRRPK